MYKLVTAIFSFVSVVQAFAQQPSAQPSNMTFSNIKPYGFVVNYAPSTADGFLILRSANPITFVPIDGEEYELGQGVAPGVKVFGSEWTSSKTIREVTAGFTYYFAVFAFNGSGEQIDYLNTNPLSGSITVPEGGPGNYYAGISGGSSSFLNDLKVRLNTGRVFQTYTPGYLNTVTDNIYIRDTVGGKEVINCQYTGETKVFTPPFFWSSVADEYTREHCLPKSWMHTGGNTDNQDGADYHNLIPANHGKANGKRSNVPYGIVQNVTYQYLEGKLGTNSQGITVYEPRNDIKGDVARAQFYMMVCYNNNGGTWGYQSMPSLAPQQSQDLLKIWHDQDPPSDFERTKHEYIYSLQYNRNPFIDFPELVGCINFNNMTRYANCVITLDADEETANMPTFNVFPNPASNQLSIEGSFGAHSRISIVDLSGRLLLETLTQEAISNLVLDISMIPAGVYSLQIQDGQKSGNQKIIISK